ncbi:hypothetical protein STEG23_008838 [Scotinomys teguina]
MARKAGQWEEEEVAQSDEEEERSQPAKKRRCRVTAWLVNSVKKCYDNLNQMQTREDFKNLKITDLM